MKININNGQRVLDAAPGEDLLYALAARKIFLPSACGGNATCGMCKCHVIEGGGDLLPSEAGLIDDEMARQGLRLACQVRVERDIKIQIPDDVLAIREFEGTVLATRYVATFIKELVIDLPPGVDLHHKAGEFVQVHAAQTDKPCFRAYSMANHPAEGNIVMLNVRISPPPANVQAPPGRVSSYLFALKAGDQVRMSGPFGTFYVKNTKREMVYIGGGAGMAPLRSHIFDLFHTKHTDRKVSYWYGARSLQEMFYEQDFRDIEKACPNFTFHVALSEPRPEDHWTGHVGLIHQVVLNEYLKNHEDPTGIEYYLCGPPLMIGAIQLMLRKLGVKRDMIAFDEF